MVKLQIPCLKLFNILDILYRITILLKLKKFMCSILFAINNNQRINLNSLRRFLQRYRGPDDFGILSVKN